MLRKPDYFLEQLCYKLSKKGVTLKEDQKATWCPVSTVQHDSERLLDPCRVHRLGKFCKVVHAVGKNNNPGIRSDGSMIVVKNFAHLASGAPCVI